MPTGQLGQIAHSIKPAVDTLLISSAREHLITIEHSAKNASNLNQLPELVSVIAQTLREMIADLKRESSHS